MNDTLHLWAKKSRDNEPYWLPLIIHLADSASIAAFIWDQWLSEGVRRAIADSISKPDDARLLYIFLAAAHDVGKATPVFQAKSSAFIPNDLDIRIEENILATGLPIKPYRDFTNSNVSPHALATQLLLLREGFNDPICAILGAHHGKPVSTTDLQYHSIETQPTNYHMGALGRESWTAVQRDVIHRSKALARLDAPNDLPVPGMSAQVLLTGLVIIADWIASNERLFPYVRIGDDTRNIDSRKRAKAAWDKLNLPFSWSADSLWIQTKSHFQARFGFDPNAVQAAAADATSHIYQPGIWILEAPTGCGKTETALAAAEALANKSKRSGLLFALPTQATSDGIFPRIRSWVDKLGDSHAMVLAHGKAQFNEEYLSLFEGGRGIYDEEGAFVHGWFEGSKKALLADFVVATVDQLLMMALKQKHVMLRHLGLSNKVVVIDECHAYDAYMNQYLDMALRWLGAYRVPVIVLSATLPAKRRRALVEAYLDEPKPVSSGRDVLGRGRKAESTESGEWAISRAYPLLTYTDAAEIKSAILPSDIPPLEVAISYIGEGELADQLSKLLAGGGCAGVIVNTVRRAQAMAGKMRARFGEDAVRLLHARFLAPDRARNEANLLRELGKPSEARRPEQCVVIGTQVLEQSLDIDFDVLVTDLCPMDLLIQRMGRMHRHNRSRPERLCAARCLILQNGDGDFTEGTAEVYKRYPLMRTRALLPERIVLPRDVSNLVQDAYDEDIPLPSEPTGYSEAREEWLNLTARKERNADAFRIGPPWRDKTATLNGWLTAGSDSLGSGVEAGLTEQMGEAKVRDSDESFEVLLFIESDGAYRFFPWIEGGRTIPDDTLSTECAKALARQRIRIPRPLCMPWTIRDTISELEDRNARFAAWRMSPWLRSELFLPMDDHLTARLLGYVLHYDRLVGLTYEKEGKGDV